MKKKILLILLLLLIPFSSCFAKGELLGHILWDANNNDLYISPYGVEFKGKACNSHYSNGGGCDVCTASGGKYIENQLKTTAAKPDKAKFKIQYARLTGVPDALNNGNIEFENEIAYQCNNGSIYNVMNVYYTPKSTEPTYYSLSVTGDNGISYIDGEKSRAKQVAPGFHKINFDLSPGYIITGVSVYQHKDNKTIYPNTIPLDVWVDQDTTVNITAARTLVSPGIEIYDAIGNKATNTKLVASPEATVKDTSTYTPPGSRENIPYGSNPHRIWRIYNNSSKSWDIMRNSDGKPITSESFKYTIPDGQSVSFQVIHSKYYDLPITDPDAYLDNEYASAWVSYTSDSTPHDFKILHTPTHSTETTDVTDKIWEYDSDTANITLVPDNKEKLDPTKIKWKSNNPSITIDTDSSSGIATTTIPKNTQILFDMYYDGKLATQHNTKFFNDVSPDFTSIDFKIKHNADDITDKSFHSALDSQSITLKPIEEYSSYYWTYKTADMKNFEPLPKGEETRKEPQVTINYYQYYTFRLSANGEEIEHNTLMLPSPPPSGLDFKIKHNETDRTDKKWYSNSDSQLVTLIPEITKASSYYWTYKTTAMTKFTPLPDGQESKERPQFTVKYNQDYIFKLTVDGKEVEHYTIMMPLTNKLNFKIMHDEIDVTDSEWNSESDSQLVNLLPTGTKASSYYWTYKTTGMSDFVPLPKGEESKEKPQFTVKYNQYYMFKLTADGKIINHHTIMLPPENPLKVETTIFSPFEYNIHDIPEGENVYITPITIKLTPQFSGSVVLDNTWHWEVWLTGQNNRESILNLLINADSYNPASPESYKYETIEGIEHSSIPDKINFTYRALPYDTKEITIPYWVTDRDVGRRISFTAYARLVCSDGRISDYDSSVSSTLLVDKITGPIYEYTEYITSIDNIIETDATPIYDAGDSIPFFADISQTNTITVSANKDILAQNLYPNSGNDTTFKSKILLKSTGDYDEGRKDNILTLTGNHINGTHTATQELPIKVNWFIGGHTGGGSDPDPAPDPWPTVTPNKIGNADNSALKIVSTRDLRWKTVLNNATEIRWGLSTDNGKNNTALLTDYILNSTNISKLKTGYAVEFSFDTTKAFTGYGDRNIQINVKFLHKGKDVTNKIYYRNTYGGEAKILDNEYKSFNLQNTNHRTKFNVTTKPRADGGETHKFSYYIPGTAFIKDYTVKDGDQLDVYFNISVRRGTTEYFNYNSLAKKLYNGWNGWVFSYDLNKSNLDDIYNNAN